MIAVTAGQPSPPLAPLADSTTLTVEVLVSQPIQMFLYVSNRGCSPLVWTVRDVEPGTQLDCPWISEQPDSGTVPPGDAMYFNAHTPPFFKGGVYEAELQFASNDTFHRLFILYLRLVVVAPVPTRRTTLGELKARFRDATPAGR